MSSDVGTGRIAVVGSTNIDLITYTSRVPGPGETLVGESFQMGFGGKGANQAVMASLLGADVFMVNCLGDDDYGELTLKNFETFGVDTTHVHIVEGSSGVAPIWVEPDGTNRILIIPGANNALTPQQAVEAIESFTDLSIVIGQFEIPQNVTAAAFAAAKARGATTILNPAPVEEIDADLLSVTDWLIPNEVEFAVLSDDCSLDDDESIADFAERTGTRLLITLGAEGTALVTREGVIERYPAKVVEAIDTTGAGDAFVGAFAYGLALGLDERGALHLGTVCSAESVTRPGTQTSFPPKERCEEILSDLRGEGA